LETSAEPLISHAALWLCSTGKYMRMDAAALRALNVLRQRQDPNDTFSLYGLLNKSRTPMGKRLLLRWLKQPLLDVAAINERHDVVEAMCVPEVCFQSRLSIVSCMLMCVYMLRYHV
jgi:DNA mismatch repair ATPase MutS